MLDKSVNMRERTIDFSSGGQRSRWFRLVYQREFNQSFVSGHAINQPARTSICWGSVSQLNQHRLWYATMAGPHTHWLGVPHKLSVENRAYTLTGCHQVTTEHTNTAYGTLLWQDPTLTGWECRTSYWWKIEHIPSLFIERSYHKECTCEI